ncbi:MAG TPA: large conductance mechanosensitive channel protein MscL [Parvularcula sp.]|nr:large conductance mechanosensitive channel protein MscL [Parvularcula sp.]HBS33126.1 large conductance mechanosensitive channel protein MscL [Parvularcula sp.]
MGIIKEFQEFAIKGNMVDMAVGIIMGGAFGTIVSSLVNDVIMPPIGLLIGGIDFSKLALVLKPAEGDVAAVAINYGKFFNAMISFLIVAWVLFMLIKGMNNLKKKQEAAPPAPPAPTKDQVLLTEIRDLLARR